MGFFDFLKQKVQIKKLKFTELRLWIKDKKIQVRNSEKSVLGKIRFLVLQFIHELDDRLKILEKIDLEGRKEEQRVKLIVIKNLNNYISYVKRLIQNLKEIYFEDIKDTGNKINTILADFKNKSSVSYEKATILIGKEIEDINKILSSFFKKIKNILRENENLLEESEIVMLIDNKIKELDKIEKSKFDNKAKIETIKGKIKEIEEKNQNLKKELQKIKESKNYLAVIEKRKEKEEIIRKLGSEKQQLRSMIDYKKLANVYHNSKKEMELIKRYKETFEDAFSWDKGKKLISLLDGANLNKMQICTKIEEIFRKQEQLNNIEIPFDETEELNLQIERNISQIKDLNFTLDKIEKSNKKLESNKENIIASLARELIKLNIELCY